MRIALLEFCAAVAMPDYAHIADTLRAQGHTVWLTKTLASGQQIWHDGEQSAAQHFEPDVYAQRSNLANTRLIGDLIVRFQLLLYILRIRRIITKLQPDIVQVNPNIHWVWLLPIGMPKSIHFVLDWRQLGERDTTRFSGKVKNSVFGWKRSLLSKYIYDRAVFTHASGATRALGEEWQRWSDVIPTGVNCQFLTASRTRAVEPQPQKVVRFLYIGTIARVRRLELLLEAAKLLTEKTENFELVFLGSDGTNGYYQRQVQKLNLERYVTIRPPVPYETVPYELLAHDVCMAYVPEKPEDWKYYPTLKVLEYRALGVPIIATAIEPNLDYVQDEVNGMVVPNDPAAFAEAMFRFVVDPTFLARCTANATNMRQGLMWSDVALMYEALYDQMTDLAQRQHPESTAVA